MEISNPQNDEQISCEPEALLKRVNEAFDKIEQDVKNMINDNKQEMDNE